MKIQVRILAALLGLALVTQILPQAANRFEVRPLAASGGRAERLTILDVCNVGGELSSFPGDQPSLPSGAGGIIAEARPSFYLPEPPPCLCEGYPRLLLRPPRA